MDDVRELQDNWILHDSRATNLTSDFLDSIAVAAERKLGPVDLPWPRKDNLGGFVRFANFAEWRDRVLGLKLPDGIPHKMMDGFERAQKLYLIAWIDFDLIVAGDMVAFATLELVVRDCYGGKERDRRWALVAAKAERENRPVTKKERSWTERIDFADLLKYMPEHDALTDDKLPLIRRSGGTIIGRLTGKHRPSLAELRNVRAHGNPFGCGFESGLLEVIHDLIEYAYRDKIKEAHNLFPDRSLGQTIS